MKRFAILAALLCLGSVTHGGRGVHRGRARRGCRDLRGPYGERSNPPFVDHSVTVKQPTQRMQRLRKRWWERRMSRLLDSLTK